MRHVSFFLSHHHPVNACTYTQVHTHTHTPPTKNRKGLHIQFICKTWCRRSWFQKTKNLKMDIFIPKFLLYLPHSNDVCVWVCAHVCVCMCVCVHASIQSLQLCPALGNPMACKSPGSSVKEFSRQEYWSGLPCPPPGNLPDPGIEPTSPALQADSLSSLPQLILSKPHE